MAEATWVMSLGGEEMMTTCDVFTQSQPDSFVANSLALFWQSGPASVLSQDLALNGIIFGGNFYPEPATGAVNQPSCPSNVAVVARKNVALGRGGRFFFPGVSENNVDAAGRLIQNFVPLFNAACVPALAQLEQNDVFLRVIDKLGNPAVVTSITSNSVVGTQRRRLATR